jgi:hypothetical protein
MDKLRIAGRYAQADDLRLYRSIATRDRSAPLPSRKHQVPTWRERPPYPMNGTSLLAE